MNSNLSLLKKSNPNRYLRKNNFIISDEDIEKNIIENDFIEKIKDEKEKNILKMLVEGYTIEDINFIYNIKKEEIYELCRRMSKEYRA